MPPRAARALRTKKPVKYITETDEDGNEIISSEVDDDVKPEVKLAAKPAKKGKKVVKSEEKDPDFAAEVAEEEEEEESDKENVEVTPQSKNKKRKTSALDDSDEEACCPIKKADNEASTNIAIVCDEEDADACRIGSSLARDLEEMRERAKKARAEKDADFDRLLNEVDNVRESPIPQPKKRTSKKSNKIDGFTVEQWRRQLGNKAKATISFQKWTIKAQTHFTNPFTSEAFRALIVPHADEVHPANFNEKTPVIMASTNTYGKAGDIMGSSKLTGGSRYGTFHADKVDYIYVASKKELRVWFTMYGH